jgi:hypothetical protein
MVVDTVSSGRCPLGRHLSVGRHQRKNPAQERMPPAGLSPAWRAKALPQAAVPGPPRRPPPSRSPLPAPARPCPTHRRVEGHSRRASHGRPPWASRRRRSAGRSWSATAREGGRRGKSRPRSVRVFERPPGLPAGPSGRPNNAGRCGRSGPGSHQRGRGPFASLGASTPPIRSPMRPRAGLEPSRARTKGIETPGQEAYSTPPTRWQRVRS